MELAEELFQQPASAEIELAEEIFQQPASAEAAQPIQTNRKENITHPTSVTSAFFVKNC